MARRVFCSELPRALMRSSSCSTWVGSGSNGCGELPSVGNRGRYAAQALALSPGTSGLCRHYGGRAKSYLRSSEATLDEVAPLTNYSAGRFECIHPQIGFNRGYGGKNT